MDKTEKKHNVNNSGNELERVLKCLHTLVFSVNFKPDIIDHIKGDQKAEEIASALIEARQALLMASKGDFSYKIASKGFLPATLKSLQANLNHLSWMTKRIAGGDLQQRVNFIGEFSDTFNMMVEQLSSTLKKLREEEERWQLAMLCSRDGLWEINLDSGALPYYSLRLFELLKISAEDAPLVADWPKFFHRDDHDLLTLYRRFVSWNDPPHSFELDHKLRCADGNYRWFHTRGMMLLDPVKGNPLRIIGVVADIQDRKEREEHFSYWATHDVLTDLPNRMLFDEHLKNSIALAKRAGSYVAVVMVDLDKFKDVNDTYGHETGDHVLVEIANRMQKSMRESDMVSRFGGDEFAMILSFGKNKWQTITKILERTMIALKKPVLIDDKEIFLTASLGVSVCPDDGDSPKTLIMLADEAMYHAKTLGRNVCVLRKRGKRFTVAKLNTE